MKKVVICIISFCFLFWLIACSPDSKQVNNSINSMVSLPNGNIALATMKQSGLPARRADDDSYTLTVESDGNFIPLIFKLDSDENVSLNAKKAFVFDNYLLCQLSGIVRYKNEINEKNIEDYISGNIIDCDYSETWIDDTILVDLHTGQVVNITKFNVLPWYDSFWSVKAGFDADNIYLESDGRILKISKDNLNSGEYITSSLESVGIDYVLGDYIYTNPLAYLIDNSDKAIQMENSWYLNNSSAILVPNNPEAGYVFILCSRYGSYREWILYKMSVEKGSFGKFLGQQQLSDFPGEPLYYKSFRLDIPNALKPYTQTVEKDGYYHQGGIGALFAESTWDFTWNVIIDSDAYYYFEEDDTDFGVHLVRKPVSGYSCLDDLKYGKSEWGNSEEFILYITGADIYFLTTQDKICHLNILTGFSEYSDFTIDISRFEENFIKVSGTQVIFREMITGSDYVTKTFDVTDLHTSPKIVEYELNDVISIDNFTL